MRRGKNIFILLTFFLSLALVLSACGGGGGSSSHPDPTGTGDNGGTTGDGGTSEEPQFTGFGFTIREGDFWEYGWDTDKSSWAQSPDMAQRAAGPNEYINRFRITLGSAKEIEGITSYEVSYTGWGDFAQSWKYLALGDNKVYGSKDGNTLTVLFDAQTGLLPGSGFFSSFSSNVLYEAWQGNIDNDYMNDSALVLSKSTSSSQCEYYSGYGTICGNDESSTMIEREYYKEGIGPVGYYYYYSWMDCGGGYCSGGSTEHNIGLVASSLRGDTVDYELETESNDSPGLAQTVSFPTILKGSSNYDTSEGTEIFLNDTPEDQNNDSLQSAQSISIPAFVRGDTHSSDPNTYQIFDYQGTLYGDYIHDWYSFTLDSTSDVTVELNYEDYATANLGLLLFNDAADTLLDYRFQDPSSSLSITLSPGTYIIGVVAYDTPGGRVTYTLDLYTDNKSNEKVIEDWYAFTLNSQTPVTVTLDYEYDQYADLDIFLFDSSANNLLGFGSQGIGLQESISVTLGSGTYLIGIDSNNTRNYNLTIE